MAPSTTQVTREPTGATRAAAEGADRDQRARRGDRGWAAPGRPTLVCGPAGSGKTLLAMEFLVRGITEFGEPGVFMAFEETRDDLVANVASLGLRPRRRSRPSGKLVLDHVNVVAAEMVEAGDWDLEGLFIRLGAAIDAVGAKRVVIDTIETLFGAFTDAATLRAELQRLFGWLKDRGVTVVITGERGEGQLTRHGIEEYVSDCVIVLDHRVTEQTSTRRLRILKYRGSLHGTNEYPFLIGEHGISVQPITSLGLQHAVSSERVSTGVDRLDAMLGGGGPLPRQLGAGQRDRRHRQVHARRAVLRRGLRARGAGDLLRLRGVPGPDHPQHVLGRPRPGPVGEARPAAVPLRAARACSASRRICSRCRSSSRSSIRRWS